MPRAVEVLGGLEVLVNCAGIGAQGRVEDNDDSEWHHVFDVNVIGMVRVTRACLPALRASAPAAIVNVSSIAATTGLPDRALYSATKGAVLSLTLAMAADLLRDGIRVNAVNPGTTDTPWIGRLLDTCPGPGGRTCRAERQATPRQVGLGARGGGRDRLPGFPGGGLHDGHVARRRRRDGKPTASAPALSMRRVASVIRLRPEKEEEYRRTSRGRMARRARDAAEGAYHQLLDLSS